MRAHPGDWLVVETSTLDRRSIRGRIEEVTGPDGEPPFTIRWTDDDHVSIFFPGPDARVVTQRELTELDRQRTERFGVHATQLDTP